jgi:serine/threonine-protein kinase
MIVNPFTFGNPVRDPEHFYGREREIRQIAGRLLSSAFESTSVVGERRIGKTSLLTYLSNPDVADKLGLARDQYVVVYVDFQGCTDITPVRFWGRVLRKVARALADEELAALAKETMKQAEIDQYDLEDLFMEIEDRGLKLVLMMDEFEYVTQNPNFGVDFFSGLRALAIHCPLALVTGTREELVDLCHSEAIKGSPFFNIFASVFLRPFSPEEATALIEGELTATPIAFSDGEKEFIGEIAGGHPIFVKMAGYYCFEARQMGLEGDGLRNHIADNFRQQADPHLTYQWNHSSESERITLLTLLALTQGKKAQPTRDQLLKAFSRAGYILPDLIKRGLIVEQDELLGIFSPLFAEWMLAEMAVGAGEEADAQTAQEWVEQRGGIEQTTWDKVKRTFPRLKREYWPLLGEFVKDASAEIAAQLILNMGRM